jgi:hypothetical protein
VKELRGRGALGLRFLRRWRARRAIRRRKSAAVAVRTTACGWLRCTPLRRWCGAAAFRVSTQRAVAGSPGARCVAGSPGARCFSREETEERCCCCAHHCVWVVALHTAAAVVRGSSVSSLNSTSCCWLSRGEVFQSGDGRALPLLLVALLGRGVSLPAPVACASGRLETEGCDEVRERGRGCRDGPGVPNNPGQSL